MVANRGFGEANADAGVARVAGSVPPLLRANASASFLLAAISKVTNAVIPKLAAISCWRMVVSFDAASASFLEPHQCSQWLAQQLGSPHGHRQGVHLLALEMVKAESHLPGLPRARHGREAFPIVNLTWEVLCCQDSRQCHHDKFDVGNRHAGPFSMMLVDTIRLHIVLHHVHAKQDHVEGMKPSTVGVKKGHDFDGRDLCVEGVGIFEVIVPNLVGTAKGFTRWCLRWSRQKATFQACHVQDAAERPSQSSSSHGKC
jgi:hypothetical protein